jgi:hypothetical protein
VVVRQGSSSAAASINGMPPDGRVVLTRLALAMVKRL